MKTILFIIFLVFFIQNMMYQDVIEIWTNYKGFWNSSEASPNPVLPDNSHEILAFKFINTSCKMISSNIILVKSNASASYIPPNYLNDEVRKLIIDNLTLARINSKLNILEVFYKKQGNKLKTIDYRSKQSVDIELKSKNLISKYIT